MNAEPSPLVDQIKKGWSVLVSEQAKPEKLQGITCAIYARNETDVGDESAPCVCGRSKRRHSFDGEPKKTARSARRWKSEIHAEPVDLIVYGQLASGARVCSSPAQK